MTQPTITYGHGYFTDMTSATYWGAKTDSGDPLTGVTITVDDGDVIKIEGTCDNAADEYVSYNYDMTNISSDTYTKFYVRYKTSAASNGLQAKVILNFTVGTQTILAESYNTEWTVASGTITAGKTIDTIDIYADDTDAVAAGTFQVYYDFILLCKGSFSFPACHIEDLDLVNEYVDVGVPGRSGDVTQFLGAKTFDFKLQGEMENWGTWGSGSGASQSFGSYIKDVFDNADSEPFQWFTSDDFTDKVTCRRFYLSKDRGIEAPRKWNLELKRYSLSDYNAASWD